MNDFKDISLRGRIAYGTMCAENYALKHHPERDWTFVFERLWSIAGDIFWDTWSSDVIDILPEYVSDNIAYDPDDYDNLSEAEHERLCAVYRGMPGSWATIMREIVDMEQVYAYTSIPGCGQESLESLRHIVSILSGEGVELPDPQTVSFSSFSERKGRGEPFDPHGLSRVISQTGESK